jgi:hypothetical protein
MLCFMLHEFMNLKFKIPHVILTQRAVNSLDLREMKWMGNGGIVHNKIFRGLQLA